MPDDAERRLSVNRTARVEVPAADEEHSRAAVLRKAAAGGALVAGGVLVGGLPSVAAAKPSRRQDRRILAFLLELEEVQAAFYARARADGALVGELRQFAELVGAHERRHVDHLRRALGRRRRAARAGAGDFGDTTRDAGRFVAAASALEDTVVAAFNGQGPNLTRSGLATVAGILSVEARHAAWIRAIANEIPAPWPNDPLATERQAVGRLTRVGFLD
jgi:hypothetical protein